MVADSEGLPVIQKEQTTSTEQENERDYEVLPELILKSYRTDEEYESDSKKYEIGKENEIKGNNKLNKEYTTTGIRTSNVGKKRRRNKISAKRTIILNQPVRTNKGQFKNKQEKIKEKIKKTVQQLTKEEIEEKGMLEPWGDTLKIQDNWPRENTDGRIRIISININRISPQSNYLEWEIILGNMADMQADIFVIQEAKLDFTSRIRDDINEKAKQFDRHIKIIMNSSRQEPNKKGSVLFC